MVVVKSTRLGISEGSWRAAGLVRILKKLDLIPTAATRVDLLVRGKASKKKTGFFLHVFLCEPPPESAIQVGVGLSSNDLIKKALSQE